MDCVIIFVDQYHTNVLRGPIGIYREASFNAQTARSYPTVFLSGSALRVLRDRKTILRFGLTMSTKRHCGPKLNIKRKIIREGHNR